MICLQESFISKKHSIRQAINKIWPLINIPTLIEVPEIKGNDSFEETQIHGTQSLQPENMK